MDTERHSRREGTDATGAVEFRNDWRPHRGTLAATVLAGALGTVVMLAAVRSADSADDWSGLVLFGMLFTLAGAMLTVGVAMPLILGWDADRVVLRCSPEGISAGDDTYPWNTVRTVTFGYEVVETGPESNPEGRPTHNAYHVEIGTDAGTVRVPGDVWRTRGQELASTVRRYAPQARGPWQGRSTFRPKRPPRPAPPSPARARTKAVALVAASLLLGAVLCATALHWAPAVVTPR
ncbi:hypothetical protein [Streptomyces wuyuanensis]|uniref:hypothetical protein n=1 Tax=Streptomyces wuyuanensis TaxID=1196353 RepID=UPI003D748CCC